MDGIDLAKVVERPLKIGDTHVLLMISVDSDSTSVTVCKSNGGPLEVIDQFYIQHQPCPSLEKLVEAKKREELWEED